MALPQTSSPRPQESPLPAWQAYILAFTASACTLIIELVAGRIMAPIIGVSLYTWTSIIGVVLAGISLGNFIGGKLADRFGSRRTLFVLFILSGLAALSVLYTATAFSSFQAPQSLPLLLRIVVFTAAIFFLPSCVLGTISPLLVKLTLRDLSRSGDIVGKIYAVSTAGSILGTFATGFYLISLFGTRPIMLGVGITCFVLALLFGDWSWIFRRKSAAAMSVFLIAAAVATYWLLDNGSLKSECLKETNYYCIKVSSETKDNEHLKLLVLDHLVHSYNSIENPQHLTYGYEFTYAAYAEYMARRRPDGRLRVLFIGGGGYTFPRYLQSRYPGTISDVIEIDPEVTQVAIQYLGLEPRSDIRSINLDARLAVAQMPADQVYDLIIGDAFHGLSVPYHLTTLEFTRQLKSHLAPDGIYLVNLIDGRKAEFVRSEAATLSQAFSYVAAMPVIEQYTEQSSNLWVVVGSSTPLQREAYFNAAEVSPRPDIAKTLWDGTRLTDFLASGRAVVLTDEYAPVDNLLAPVLEERGY